MRTTGRISVVAAVLLALAFGSSSASAAPQGPWVLPASNLSADGQSASTPEVATAPDGTETAVWSRSNGTNEIIQAANRSPGGSFGTPVDLSTPGQGAGSPQVAVAIDGTTSVVWYRNDGSNDIVQAATRPPGGTFGAPVDLSVPGRNAYNPRISVAFGGTTTVVWKRKDGSNNYIIQAATRPPGGSFGAPVDLSTAGQDASGFQISTAPDGTATVVWNRPNGPNNIVQSATRPPGGSFAPPIDLSVAGHNAFDPRITAAPDGTTTVVWYRSNGSKSIVQASTRPAGGSFALPVDLSTTDQNAYLPDITTAPDGTATAVWYLFNGSKNIIQAATRPPGTTFGLPVDLTTGSQDAFDPEVVTAPDGTATVLWYSNNGTNSFIQAATRPPGGSFGSPVDLSATGEYADGPHVTVATDGTATAVWPRNDGSNIVIQSVSTAQPSVTVGVAKSGSGTVKSSPAGIDCGDDCSGNYLSFTKVTLTATPDLGSTFTGWGGACEGSAGNTCVLTLLENQNVNATFESSGRAKLKVTRLKPKKPKVKRGKTVKIKVTGKNIGDATATGARLCIKLKKSVRKKLKPKGKRCQKLGSLGPGKTKTRTFKLKATGKAKKGKKYKVTFKLSAKGVRAAGRTVKVKVK